MNSTNVTSNTRLGFDLDNPICKLKVCTISFGAKENFYYAVTRSEEVIATLREVKKSNGEPEFDEDFIQENYGRLGLWYNYYYNDGRPDLICKVCKLVEQKLPTKEVTKISQDIHENV